MSNPSSARPPEPEADAGTGNERPDTPSPVRERTLRRLRKLVARGAAAGAAASMSGCPPVVCDPLPPPPVDCAGDLTNDVLAQWASWQARWVQSGDGFAVEMTLSLFSPDLAFAGDPVLDGAMLVASTPTDTELTFTMTPVEGAATVTVSAAASCDTATGTLRLAADVSGTPQVDAVIPVTLAE